MICLLICEYVLLWGSWQILQGRTINQLYCSACNTFHCQKPHMPLPLGNLIVCHAEGFSPQKALLDTHQRQLGSIFCGLHCPRGQELSLSLVTHFKSIASFLFPSSFYLLWPSGQTGKVSGKCWSMFKSCCSVLHLSPTVSLGSRTPAAETSSLQVIHCCLQAQIVLLASFPQCDNGKSLSLVLILTQEGRANCLI